MWSKSLKLGCFIGGGIYMLLLLAHGLPLRHLSRRCFGRDTSTSRGTRHLETNGTCIRGAKLWRGKSHERIRHEKRPVSCERMKTPRGFKKPEGGGVVGLETGDTKKPLLIVNRRCREQNLKGGVANLAGITPVLVCAAAKPRLCSEVERKSKRGCLFCFI